MQSLEKTNPAERFDPFTSRACRQVRNDLAHSLVTAISTRNPEPVSTLVHTYLSGTPTVPIQRYLIDRRERYRSILAGIRAAGFANQDIWPIAMALWNEQLFFEVHEWLEQAWHQSRGDTREGYQAVIRAAGVYIHLEAGRRASALQLASKAVEGLGRQRNLLAGYFDVARLLEKLEPLDPVPPKLVPAPRAGTRTGDR